MARKRSPEHDYICRRCGCACDQFEGGKHLGGGSRSMKACKGPIMPVLRSDFEAEIARDVEAIRNRIGRL